MLTTFVAVFGLFISVQNGNQQRMRDDAIRNEDRFDATIKELAEGQTPVAQLSALEALRPYWRDRKFRPRVQSALLAILNEKVPLSVRAAIREQVSAVDDDEIIEGLAVQNRFIQSRIRALGISPDSVYPDTFRFPVPQTDSAYRAAVEDLEWNISALISTMNNRRKIRRVDLSGVKLSIIAWHRVHPGSAPWALEPTGDTIAVYRQDTASFRTGMLFADVNLYGARLTGHQFTAAAFVSVDLDNAELGDVQFFSCEFSKVSLRNFQAIPDIKAPRAALLNHGPAWSLGELNALAFSPRYSRLGFRQDLVYFSFGDTKWNIVSASRSDSLISFAPPDERLRRRGLFDLEGRLHRKYFSVRLQGHSWTEGEMPALLRSITRKVGKPTGPG
jgi:hypothetical protein